MTDKEVLEILNESLTNQRYLEIKDKHLCKIALRLHRRGYKTEAVHIVDTISNGLTCVWYFPSNLNPLTEKGMELLSESGNLKEVN